MMERTEYVIRKTRDGLTVFRIANAIVSHTDAFRHAQNIRQHTSNSAPDMLRRTRSDYHQIDVLAIAGRWCEMYFVQERAAAHSDLSTQERIIEQCRHCPA